jgi:hypothetical protein
VNGTYVGRIVDSRTENTVQHDEASIGIDFILDLGARANLNDCSQEEHSVYTSHLTGNAQTHVHMQLTGVGNAILDIVPNGQQAKTTREAAYLKSTETKSKCRFRPMKTRLMGFY